MGSDTDRKGEDLFRRYRLERLKNLTEAGTHEENSSKSTFMMMRILCAGKNTSQGMPSSFVATLMTLSVHTFRNVSSALKVSLINNSDNETLIKSFIDMEDFSRKKLTRQGLEYFVCQG